MTQVKLVAETFDGMGVEECLDISEFFRIGHGKYSVHTRDGT